RLAPISNKSERIRHHVGRPPLIVDVVGVNVVAMLTSNRAEHRQCTQFGIQLCHTATTSIIYIQILLHPIWDLTPNSECHCRRHVKSTPVPLVKAIIQLTRTAAALKSQMAPISMLSSLLCAPSQVCTLGRTNYLIRDAISRACVYR